VEQCKLHDIYYITLLFFTFIDKIINALLNKLKGISIFRYIYTILEV
jgi:hypothetical protein